MFSEHEAKSKWVTFDDLVDDAMEGGKLSPINLREDPDPIRKRRVSMTSGPVPISGGDLVRSSSVAYMSTSLSSNSSFGSGSGSLGSPEAVKIPKPPANLRRKRFSKSVPRTQIVNETPALGLSLDSASGNDAYAAIRKLQVQVTPTPENTNARPGCGDDDRYAALNSVEGHTGWSDKVRGPFGWSDKIIDGSNDNNRLKIEEEPWYKGHSGLRNGTWDRSPSRRFVRNFP